MFCNPKAPYETAIMIKVFQALAAFTLQLALREYPVSTVKVLKTESKIS